MLKFIRAEFAKTSASRLLIMLWLGGLIGLLLHAALFGGYIANGNGRPIPGEFLTTWSGGQMMASGRAAAAYDADALHQLQVSDVGHPFVGYFLWLFPPPFLFVAALLAQFPFVVAYIGWSLATFIAYGVCISRIFRDRSASIVYGLSPAAFMAFVIAQDGLFTAALFGGALLMLNKRPLASGLLFAALAYKPQFGLLVPVALLAGGYWRTFATASAATIAWLVGWLVIDRPTIEAFQRALFLAHDELLTLGHQGLHKIQSVYGLARTLGLNDGWASVLAALCGLILFGIVVAAWRSTLSYPTKAAILVLSSLGATPYLYIYDFPVLTIAIGFLWRDAAFDRFERAAIAIAYVLIAAYAVLALPFGPLSLCAVGVCVARRHLRLKRSEFHAGVP